jgi:hypothetical protein
MGRLRSVRIRSAIGSSGGYLPLAAGVCTIRYPMPERIFDYVSTVWGATAGTCHEAHSAARYPITSSATPRSVGGTVMPSAFAVLRLMASVNLVGCMIGRSPGLSPLRTRPT